ncbi:integrating conjugative element protein family [Congregibacter litoralis KT71]|uniref:Integrating conjugative element protein family n=1 Tax=Congregibacter litoralis KT71 TaxID=314285 RepID=A4A4E5_9GAMM|nr:integrating conjugative element protein family [Congregibacter litoralis KT71]
MRGLYQIIAKLPAQSLFLAVLSISPTYGAQGPTEDSFWYYQIGGAQPISAPANPSVVSVTLGGSAQLGLGYSCAKFDPVAAVTHTLNNIKSGADDMMNAMTAAASSAIAALPALILQRANPGLYDLFQNALLKAEETVRLATKSCEQMEAEIAQGKNPYADLVVLSKGNDWKVQMGIGGNDAVAAKDAVEASNGDNGVPWIGGPAGGAGQPELRFTGDIVEAGYNITMNRPTTETAAVPSASATRLSDIWSTPAAARDWVVDVVGENIVTTCDTCRKDSIPGTGLLPQLYRESALITTELASLVSGATPPTLANLEMITAPGVAVTRQVIEAIRGMPNTEQGLIIGRLVSEISTGRTIEKALLARRMLLSGRQVPEVYATEVAREHADTAIAELDNGIESLLFETRVRREVVSDTVKVLLERAAVRRRASMNVPEGGPIDPRPLSNGRVQ